MPKQFSKVANTFLLPRTFNKSQQYGHTDHGLILHLQFPHDE